MGRYCMSICGSLRYMPPEVGMDQPYNESCDVYSLSMVLWEMFTLRQVFDKYTNETNLIKAIYNPPYKRPLIKNTWPTPIQVLLHKSWHPMAELRPTMKSVAECLKVQLMERQDWNTDELDHLRRRSTFVFQWRSEKSLRNRLHSSMKSGGRSAVTKPSQHFQSTSGRESVLYREDSAIQ